MLWRLLTFTLAGPALGLLVLVAFSIPFGMAAPSPDMFVLALGVWYTYGAAPLLVAGLVDHLLSPGLPIPYRLIATAAVGGVAGVMELSLVASGAGAFGLFVMMPALLCSWLTAKMSDGDATWQEWPNGSY